MPNSDEAQSKLSVNEEGFMRAAAWGDMQVLNSLSNYELIDALAFRTSAGLSLVQIAALFGNTQVVKFLTEADDRITKGLIDTADAQNEADINLEDGNKDQTDLPNGLHIALLNGLDIIAEMFISKGADLNVKDKDGLTPLHCAASTGNLEMVKRFIAKDVKFDELCNTGRTPLMMAVINNHLEIAQYLIRRGADWTNLDKAYEGGPSLLSRCSEDFSNAIVATLRELGMFTDQPGRQTPRLLPLFPCEKRD